MTDRLKASVKSLSLLTNFAKFWIFYYCFLLFPRMPKEVNNMSILLSEEAKWSYYGLTLASCKIILYDWQGIDISHICRLIKASTLWCCSIGSFVFWGLSNWFNKSRLTLNFWDTRLTCSLRLNQRRIVAWKVYIVSIACFYRQSWQAWLWLDISILFRSGTWG